MGWFSASSTAQDGSDAKASGAESPPKTERKRGLKRFDTSAFTLHEHCGAYAREVHQCLKKAGETTDPVALEENGWDALPKCRELWEEYRRCGRNFFTTVEWAHSKCEAEAEAFRKCARAGGGNCDALELAAIKCASSRIQQRMSGKLDGFLDGSDSNS